MILNRHHHLAKVRNASTSAFPIPIGPAVRTLFAERLKMRIVPIDMCQVPPIDSKRHHHLPGSKHIDQCLSHSDRTSRSDVIRDKAKKKIVPIAIGMCQVPPIASQLAQSYSRCLSTSIIASPNPIGPVVQDGFREKAKNKVCQSACAKCHRSILNRSRHLPEVETHRLVSLSFRSDQPFGRYS